jgi:HSP20 family protein
MLLRRIQNDSPDGNQIINKKIDFRTMTLFKTNQSMDAFDILFKNFFRNESFFEPLIDTRIGHPVDIYENEKGLHFEVAGTGLTKEDIKISIEGDVLQISYNKHDDEKCCNVNDCKYYHRGISKKSFNLGYRIPLTKFDINAADAEMENGLLKIHIPMVESAKPKSLKIK